MYFPNLKTNNRHLISPKEVDILIPEIKLAIEFNGIWSHSLENRTKLNYHLNKTLACEKIGYRLIHIWENDWDNNHSEIKDKLIKIFTNTEQIDLTKKLDRCWYPYKKIPGYYCKVIVPKITLKEIYHVEDCGYLNYIQI